MAIFRIEKTKDYTVMSNHHLKEKGMSLKAKGLLSLMLSLPDEWDYSIDGLVKLSKDGKESISTAIIELEKFGYLVRTQTIDKSGRFAGYDYRVYENPLTENPLTENPEQLNTNILNTNIEKEYKEKEIGGQKVNKCPPINEAYNRIFDFWNSKNIVIHKNRDCEKYIKAFKKAIKIYDEQIICLAIERYAEIYHADYYFNYKWDLDVFLSQKNCIPDFLDGGSKWENYKSAREKTKPKNEEPAQSDAEYLIAKGFSKEYVMSLSAEQQKEKREKWDRLSGDIR